MMMITTIMKMTVSVEHLREEQDHICDCPHYPLGARDERVKLKKRFSREIPNNFGFGHLLIFGADEKFLDAPRDRLGPPHNLLLKIITMVMVKGNNFANLV